MDKYIIKNCPAFCIEPTKYGNVCKKWCSSKPCQKRTDCVFKKIAELCKGRIVKYKNKDLFKAEDEKILNGEAIISRLILKLLDIQEVE